jgi:DNA-binding response OmpR family regulator
VSFADAPGGGAIFNVTLPVWDAAAGQDLDVEAQPGAVRILLCEDDRDTALAIRETMRKTGFAVDIAYTARAAIGRADAIDYAAILVDLKLPDGDGISLIVHLRAQTRHHDTPITVISVDPSWGRDDARSTSLNVLGWLSKPVDPEHLVQVVRSSIASAPSLPFKEVV